jgi:hypothetical protein
MLTWCYPLEAHLPNSFGKSSAEPQPTRVCNFGRTGPGSCGAVKPRLVVGGKLRGFHRFPASSLACPNSRSACLKRDYETTFVCKAFVYKLYNTITLAFYRGVLSELCLDLSAVG